MIAIWGFLLGCSEYVVNQDKQRNPVEPPPAPVEDNEGDAPNWADCMEGYSGMYFNHEATHEDFAKTVEDTGVPIQLPLVDWWDPEYRSFFRYDASLDFGPFWWPVDDGFETDPSYFTAQWNAWLRVYENNQTLSFVVGSFGEVWILKQDQVIYHRSVSEDYEVELVEIALERGQYPITILYAHRDGEAGFGFRLASDNGQICYPDLEE